MDKSLLHDASRSTEQIMDSQEGSLWPQVGVVGISFKSTPIALRESVARQITIEKIEGLKSGNKDFAESELALLSTCNRVEIYYSSMAPAQLYESVNSLFLLNGKESCDVYHYTGLRAARHLLSVATGLDSLVFGEAQILSQVNETNKVSLERKLSGPLLSKLFSMAYKSARRMREENPIFANGLNGSVSHAILEIINRQYAGAKPNLLLIGSGKMVRLAVSAIDRSKLGTIVVAARRKELDKIKADSIVHLSEIVRTIEEREIDVVITATTAEDHILKQSDLEHLTKISNKHLLILDISVPRNVEPQVGNIPNVTLINLDDLKGHIDSPSEQDRVSVSKIKTSLLLQSNEFFSWLTEHNEITPLMNSLRKRAETIRSEELKNAFSRMSDLTPGQKAVIETMSQRLIRRFLHEPTVRLKQLTRSEESRRAKMYSEVMSDLFGAPNEELENSTSEHNLDDDAEL